MTGLHAAYRERGADLPFGDPGRDHGARMEGYYWRIVAGETVLVVLCGVGRGADGRWGLVALASHPGTHVRYATAAPAATSPTRFGVRAGEVLDGSLERLRLRLGGEDWLELRLRARLTWPRGAFGALGAAHVVPGLAQYWHPVLLDGAASGEGCVAGRPLRLDEATVYAEKNWGPGFAGRWWWGQASAFPEEGLGVASPAARSPVSAQHPPPSCCGAAARFTASPRRSPAHEWRWAKAAGGCEPLRPGTASKSMGRRRAPATSCRCPNPASPTSRCAANRCWRDGWRFG